MNKLYQTIKRKFLPVFSIVLFIGLSASFSVAAAQKLLHQTQGRDSNIIKANSVLAEGKPSELANILKNSQRAPRKTVAQENRSENIISAQISDLVLAAAKNEKSETETTTLISIIKTATSTVATTTAASNNNNNQSQNNNQQNNSTASGNVFTLAMLATHNKAGDCYIAYKGTVYNLSNSAAWAGCQHHGATGGIDVTSTFPHPESYFNTIPIVGTLGTATANNNQNNTTNQNSTNTVDNNQNQTSNTGTSTTGTSTTVSNLNQGQTQTSTTTPAQKQTEQKKIREREREKEHEDSHEDSEENDD